jgi:hypothetical protein
MWQDQRPRAEARREGGCGAGPPAVLPSKPRPPCPGCTQPPSSPTTVNDAESSYTQPGLSARTGRAETVIGVPGCGHVTLATWTPPTLYTTETPSGALHTRSRGTSASALGQAGAAPHDTRGAGGQAGSGPGTGDGVGTGLGPGAGVGDGDGDGGGDADGGGEGDGDGCDVSGAAGARRKGGQPRGSAEGRPLEERPLTDLRWLCHSAWCLAQPGAGPNPTHSAA